MKEEECVLLSSGYRMPLVGMGTSRQETGSGYVEKALDVGYRLIDTAYFYLNEKEVGKDIARWIAKGGGQREDIFVTTKLPTTGMTPQYVEYFLKKSLENLQIDYVDLYLIHGPIGRTKSSKDEEVFPVDENNKPLLEFGTDHIAVWKAMEALVDAGLARSIGVSNYSIKQLRKTLAVARIPPAVLQTELHVYLQQPELLQFCRDNKVALTSYASLGSPGRTTHVVAGTKMIDILSNPVVQLLAEYRKVTVAQVLLKFWTQQNVAVIPKSGNPARMESNKQLFGWTLTDLEMAALKSLNRGEVSRLFDYSVGMFAAHPEACPRP